MSIIHGLVICRRSSGIPWPSSPGRRSLRIAGRRRRAQPAFPSYIITTIIMHAIVQSRVEMSLR